MTNELRKDNVGLLLISHSKAIATGVAEMVSQVAGQSLLVWSVGGSPDGTLGTDAVRTFEALRAIASERDAVVLVDLGSSVLTARAAIAMLTEGERRRVAIADAPLLEGAIAAGVAVATGASRDEVVRAAEEAYATTKL